MSRIPRFELAPLGAFPPNSLDPQNQMDAVIVALALAYNDLKDAHWLVKFLDDHQPEDTHKANSELGQWSGMREHAGRMITAISLEILAAIETADDAGVFADATFVRATKLLKPSSRRRWREVLALSHSKGGDDPVKRFLVRVRNNIAYHYYEPRHLMRGYQKHFFDSAQSALTARAFLSLGRTMGTTRFFFADAAAQAATTLLATDEIIKRSREYLLSLNEAVRNLVEAYLHLRFRQYRRQRKG